MQKSRCVELIVSGLSEKTRLDRYVCSGSDVPRPVFGRDDTVITLDGLPAKKSVNVRNGQKIRVMYTESCFEGIIAQDIPLNVIYEDSDILVIDKPQGLVVHPAAGNFEGTLVNALAFRYGQEFVSRMAGDEEEEDTSRPGIVHRLDKDTSGVMVIALNREAHAALAAQFARHSITKFYSAVCKGQFPAPVGDIENYLARDPKDRKKYAVTESKTRGKYAHTKFRVKEQFSGYAFVKVQILTGRTHQIRVHMKHIGHPIVGDSLYNSPDKRFKDAALMLHASEITFSHPRTGEEMTFKAALPIRFETMLSQLRGEE